MKQDRKRMMKNGKNSIFGIASIAILPFQWILIALCHLKSFKIISVYVFEGAVLLSLLGVILALIGLFHRKRKKIISIFGIILNGLSVVFFGTPGLL